MGNVGFASRYYLKLGHWSLSFNIIGLEIAVFKLASSVLQSRLPRLLRVFLRFPLAGYDLYMKILIEKNRGRN